MPMKMGMVLEKEHEMAMKSEDCVCYPAQCINITKTCCKGKEREVERGRNERSKELEVPSSHQLNLIRHSVYTKMQATLCSHSPLPLLARSSLCLRVDAQSS